MIKAIIFDCFGVLVEASLEPFVRKYLSHDADAAREAMLLDSQASMGEITFEHQMREFSRLAKTSYEEVERFLENNPRNEPLLNYIATELKPKWKIGMLSNASEDWLDELFTKEDLELFDESVLSYQTGIAKPQAQIYAITADKLGVRCDECIFIDDRPEYVDGAKAVGMEALVYEGLTQLKTDLGKILV